jgi:hypothetical protein
MDEFHSFNDLSRGIVWEFTLGLLPPHVRLLLLSATVGNAYEFVSWLKRAHNRNIELVQSDTRRVPLTYQWVGDQLLSEHVEAMAEGDDAYRLTPALIFCFNRDECWGVAEQLKGKRLLQPGQQSRLASEIGRFDMSQGAGPQLKQILIRGVGVHHAGVLPKYRRIVEELFQMKLLSVCVCTETLAAGINLPARSVVLPGLLKGPPDKKRLIDASSAHQMFGRAGRPQYDTRGFVFALAHEDDVKISRWKAKFDEIPEDTKDPGLRKAKKALKKKMPTRRANQQYWTESQFEKLCAAPAGKLASRGPLPWRLLAYMLAASPEIDRIRQLVAKRLMEGKRLETGQQSLDHMLRILWAAGYVKLEPEPPKAVGEAVLAEGGTNDSADYRPQYAHPTDRLARLLRFRGVNPLYGEFLLNQLGIADRAEKLQAMESLLEMPGSVARYLRVPGHDELPPGPLATIRLDVQLLQLGLATPEQLGAGSPVQEEEHQPRGMFEEERVWVLTLAEKLRLLFDHDFPGVHDLHTAPVWAAGELLEFGGDFQKFVTSKRIQKQEGVLFRHLLRLILLIAEFQQACPPDADPSEWRSELEQIGEQVASCCRRVDPSSTDKALEQAELGDEL